MSFTITKPRSWAFEGTVTDTGGNEKYATCCICHQPTRFAFIVKVRKSSALVGPDCVLKCRFVISDSVISDENKKGWLNENKTALINKAKRNRLLKALTVIEKSGFDTSRFKKLIYSLTPLSPKQLLLFIRLSQENKIKLSGDLIGTSLRHKNGKSQLNGLSSEEADLVSKFVTARQKIVISGG
jgi:hypothetical protein